MKNEKGLMLARDAYKEIEKRLARLDLELALYEKAKKEASKAMKRKASK